MATEKKQFDALLVEKTTIKELFELVSKYSQWTVAQLDYTLRLAMKLFTALIEFNKGGGDVQSTNATLPASLLAIPNPTEEMCDPLFLPGGGTKLETMAAKEWTLRQLDALYATASDFHSGRNAFCEHFSELMAEHANLAWTMFPVGLDESNLVLEVDRESFSITLPRVLARMPSAVYLSAFCDNLYFAQDKHGGYDKIAVFHLFALSRWMAFEQQYLVGNRNPPVVAKCPVIPIASAHNLLKLCLISRLDLQILFGLTHALFARNDAPPYTETEVRNNRTLRTVGNCLLATRKDGSRNKYPVIGYLLLPLAKVSHRYFHRSTAEMSKVTLGHLYENPTEDDDPTMVQLADALLQLVTRFRESTTTPGWTRGAEMHEVASVVATPPAVVVIDGDTLETLATTPAATTKPLNSVSTTLKKQKSVQFPIDVDALAQVHEPEVNLQVEKLAVVLGTGIAEVPDDEPSALKKPQKRKGTRSLDSLENLPRTKRVKIIEDIFDDVLQCSSLLQSTYGLHDAMEWEYSDSASHGKVGENGGAKRPPPAASGTTTTTTLISSEEVKSLKQARSLERLTVFMRRLNVWNNAVAETHFSTVRVNMILNRSFAVMGTMDVDAVQDHINFALDLRIAGKELYSKTQRLVDSVLRQDGGGSFFDEKKRSLLVRISRNKGRRNLLMRAPNLTRKRDKSVADARAQGRSVEEILMDSKSSATVMSYLLCFVGARCATMFLVANAPNFVGSDHPQAADFIAQYLNLRAKFEHNLLEVQRRVESQVVAQTIAQQEAMMEIVTDVFAE